MRLHTHSQITLPLAHSMISAGPAAEVMDDYDLLDLNELVTKGREGFIVFEVTGDSMVDDIRPGYLVFVDTWAQPRNGDVIASSVNGATCIKIFKQSKGQLYLVSANPAYRPREVTERDHFVVLGVVKGHLAVY